MMILKQETKEYVSCGARYLLMANDNRVKDEKGITLFSECLYF